MFTFINNQELRKVSAQKITKITIMWMTLNNEWTTMNKEWNDVLFEESKNQRIEESKIQHLNRQTNK